MGVLKNELIRLLFPDICLVCEEIYTEGGDVCICRKCMERVRYCRDYARCRICSAPVSDGHTLCSRCAADKRCFTGNYSCVVYRGQLHGAILKFKFYNRPYYFRSFAEMLLNELAAHDASDNFDLVAYVPIHRKKLKKRGYDQSRLLAEYIAKRLRLPLAAGSIVKIKDTPPQSRIKLYAERVKNVKDAFSVPDGSVFAGRRVLLIDDIYTTGATLNEVSGIILKCGAKSCHAATIAISDRRKNNTN